MLQEKKQINNVTVTEAFLSTEDFEIKLQMLPGRNWGEKSDMCVIRLHVAMVSRGHVINRSCNGFG